MRFWEYGYRPLDLNGRICFLYSIYWAVLSIVLMKYIKPKVDTLIEKIPGNKKVIDTILLIFFVVNCIFTVWGISAYQERVINNYYGIEENKLEIQKNVEEFLFSNKYMVKTFPNLRTRDKLGNEVFVRDLILD